MIVGHLPECDLSNCFCPSTAEEVLQTLAERAQLNEAKREQLAAIVWALVAPKAEAFIESVLTELEAARNG